VTRPLAVVLAEPHAVLAQLRDALSGDGPAIMPHERPSSVSGAVPATVEQKVALVVETSGSTGRPKRVLLSSDALVASAAASDSALGGPGQWLLALPVHYIAGLNVLVRSLAAQTEPVVAPANVSAESFIAAANELDHARRFVSLVPAQLARLLETDAPLEALRSFEAILVGGQSVPPSLVERATDLGLKVTRTYGSSETSGGCVYNGVPIGDTRVRVTDGRVELAGSVLAEGYLADPRRSAFAFRGDDGTRWYRTDDAGELTDGVLTISGRVDDVIVSGGVKVSLSQIENTVRALPGLGDAVVVAAPHPEWGEAPVVVSTVAVPLDVLRDAVTASLGKAAAPARLLLLDVIPMLPSGKPDRLSIATLALQ
jgi:o-succinylbenzoate---CoA ligase